jgi:hypothetical protein
VKNFSAALDCPISVCKDHPRRTGVIRQTYQRANDLPKKKPRRSTGRIYDPLFRLLQEVKLNFLKIFLIVRKSAVFDGARSFVATREGFLLRFWRDDSNYVERNTQTPKPLFSSSGIFRKKR